MNSFRISLISTLFLSLLLLFVGQAQAIPPGPINCPAPVAKNDLQSLVGAEDIVGYTVVSGTTPVPFQVDVLGVENNAWEPGDQIIIARGSGPAIDAAGGSIAAGMSGSPVYTSDGRLIGALAYGFTMGPNDIMGITPAYQMYGDYQPIPTAARAPKRQPDSVSSRMAPLPTPMTITGLSRDKIPTGLAKLAKRSNLLLVPEGSGAGAASRSTLAAPDFSAAGVVAGSLSLGRTSMTGIGTITAVCGDQFLAFGHPFLGDPNSRGIVSAGEIFTMVNDPTLGSFKWGVATERVGLMNIDNTYAIGGIIGQEAQTIPVRGKVYKRSTKPTQRLFTEIARMPINNRGQAQYFMAEAAALALANETYKLDESYYSRTTTRGSWMIKGEANGKPFTWVRSDAWAGYEEDVAYAFYDDLYSLVNVASVWSNQKLKINSVDVDLEQSRGAQFLAVKDVSYREPGEKKWQPVIKRKAVLEGESGRVTLRVRFENSATGRIINKILPFQLEGKARAGLVRIAPDSGKPQSARTVEDVLAELKKSSSTRLVIKTKRAVALKSAPLLFKTPFADRSVRVKIKRG